MFLDVQYDRGRTDAMAETPMLSITEEREDGIVVRGWKAIGTAVSFANHILVGNLWRPGQTPDQTIYALVPIATPGVTVVARKSNAEPDADPYDRPLATIGDELDAMAYRSEEHTSELQSLMRISYAVFCLKKKTNMISYITLLTVLKNRTQII